MSGFYIGVDGKARKVKGGYIGIDGKARKIKKGYIGVDGVARLCYTTVDPVFENNTWEQIADACRMGIVPDTWTVGNQKTMNIGGTDYVIDIIGKNHDDYADGSGKAPLTFQMHDCYTTFFNMNSSSTNSGGWGNSVMRNTRLGQTLLAAMPAAAQNAVKEVSKVSAGATTSDKLFLLSEVEVFNSNQMSYTGEGKQYEYYSNGGSPVKHKHGDSNGLAWWLRSPAKGNQYGFALADANGGITYAYANGSYGVSFAFCF